MKLVAEEKDGDKWKIKTLSEHDNFCSKKGYGFGYVLEDL